MPNTAVSAPKGAMKTGATFHREGLTILSNPIDAALEYVVRHLQSPTDTALTVSVKYCLSTRTQWTSL
jgi:hypothetical protein